MNKYILYIVLILPFVINSQNISETPTDTIKVKNLILYKEHAHASYYHDKFNGKKTASGKKFDNNKLTAAHKKLPFGTKLKITNEKNNKYVIVEVTDRGPFINGREIDLTKKAFMEITSNKKSGGIIIKIEILTN